MPHYTLQSAFDSVWQHFITKRKPAGAVGTTAMYVTPAGDRCAIGLLVGHDTATALADQQDGIRDLLEFDYAGKSDLYPRDLVEAVEETRRLLDPALVDAWEALQDCHDTAIDFKDGFHGAIWSKLLDWAEKHGVEVPEAVAA